MTSRKEIYENTFSAKALFVAGILMMPALLFNPSTELRVLQFLFFLFLVFISGKKTRLPSVIIIIAGITAFNLVIPYGRILFSVGSFNITEGALRAGIHRAVTFQALVMLSKASIKQDLKMPGAFGELLGESLRIFSGMMDRKISVTGKNLIAEIDNLL
ncbi:MAG: heptaprenyl diphosphate synthase, partial [Treponema sp.]|nr:heptaprenyl diphosphate synthase [Treponema sp.]